MVPESKVKVKYIQFGCVASFSKKGGKVQESIQSSTTPDPEYHMGKWQKTMQHHKGEPRGQSFPGR